MVNMDRLKFMRVIFCVLLIGVSCVKKPAPVDTAGKPDAGAGNVVVEVPDDKSETPSGTIGLDYARLESAPHPRLIMSAEDFERLKSEVNNHEVTKKIHDYIIGRADKVCGYSDLKKTISRSLLGVSRNAIIRILFCSYAYRMTGDRKYLASAERDIMTVCSFDDWNPGHYLDVAEMATAVAFGLDWLYDDLKSVTREKARRALNDYLFETSRNPSYNAWSRLSHNKNQICNSAVIVSALATYEKNKKLAVEMLESSVVSNKTYGFSQYGLTDSDDSGGCYMEGYMYWGYGTTYQVITIAALEKIFGTSAGLFEANPSFARSAEWMLHMVGPSRLPYNFSDCDEEEQGMLPMWWFANKLDDPSLLFHEIRLVNREEWSFGEGRLLPLIFGFMDMDQLRSEIPAPTKKLWFSTNGDSALGKPCVLMHTDWTMSETDKFLGLIGGRPNVSHGHMDGASFVYDALGQRWAKELGNPTYGTVEEYIGDGLWDLGKEGLRWTVYRVGNFGHNIPHVVNNAKGGLYHNKGKAFLDASFFDSNPDRLACRFTYYGINWEGTEEKQEINNGCTVRYAEFINGDRDMMITDELAANADKSPLIRWQFATPAKVYVVEDGPRQYFRLEKGGKTMYVVIAIKSFHPGNGTDPAPAFRLKTWDAEGNQPYDEPNIGVTMCGYDVQLNGGDHITLTAVFSEVIPEY